MIQLLYITVKFSVHNLAQFYDNTIKIYYYYNHFMAPWTLSRTTQVSRYQKGKTNLDLLEQEIVSGSGIS